MKTESVQQIEDIYELTPLQQGMLFHTVKEPESDLYIEQFCYACSGNSQHPEHRGRVESCLLRQAWQLALDRHAILRTSFYWQGLEKPFQIVQQQAELPWQQFDWSDIEPAEQQARLEALLLTDRDQRFDLTNAPLMRLTFIHISENDAYLIWTFHHLLLDGWSTALLLQEVIATYTALYAGQQPRAVAEERPFKEYLLWLQRNEDEQEVRQFWQQQLQGFTTPTSLSGRPQEEFSGLQGEREIYLSKELTDSLQAFARKHRLTVNTLMQGAWALLLSQQSGEKDIAFGVTVSGRPAELTGVESMVGLFINTLPMRVQVCPHKHIDTWLAELQHRQLDIQQYGYCSLAQILGWSELLRERSLFESILVFESYPSASATDDAAITLRTLSLYEKANYPLGLMALPGEQLRLRMRYNSAVFSHEIIRQMQEQLQNILANMVHSTTQQLWQAQRLASEEEARLASWNPTPTPLADPRSLPARLRAQAERTPDAIALCFQGEALSYQALFQRAEKLAQRLHAQGARPERLVGLCVERGPRYVQALLAIVLTGAAFLPLDPHLPEQRLRFLLEDAHLDLLVGKRPLLAYLGEGKGEPIPALEMEEIWEDSRQASSAGSSLPEPLLDQLAYVIYTSGSTGVPKGVQITQRGLARLIEAECPLFSIRQGSRVLQFATPSFDGSITEIFNSLASGACLVLAPREQLLPGPDLQQVLREQAISFLALPPTALATIEGGALPALATVVSAGETCPRALVEAWQGGGQFLNAYGPTEVTVCATAGVLPTGQPLAAVPSIGGPLPHSPVYVLDEQMQRVPIGVVGELYVGGDALARGYRGQAGWTAERFVPDPFSGQAGARLYRTGDRGRWREEGELEYAGRWDRQVKLRGYRIELEEIEAVLREHPEVEDCALVVRQEENGERWLVGYVVGRGSEKGSQEGPAAWRKWLKERLPAYQVPARLVELEALPLLPSGKHNLQALPAPENARERERGSLSTVPQSTLEQAIVEIWSEALHVERIGLYDNFFDLGGHSIAALRVYGKLLPLFNGELTMTDLFTYPTISALVEHFTRVEEPQREERVNEEQIRSSQNRRQSRLKVKETLLAKRENR